MQVTTNRKFIDSRRIYGRWATVGGFVCLLSGLGISMLLNPPVDSIYWPIAYASLVPGFFLISYGKNNTIRWGINPRVDEALVTALKSFDSRFHLYNYVSGLPADNLMVSPNGVFVFELKPIMGDFINRGAKWSRKRGALGFLLAFGEGGLGNPTKDVLRTQASVRQYLTNLLGEEQAAEVPVEPIVVFTHPRATVTSEEPDVPVVNVKELQVLVRKQLARDKMNLATYRRLAQELRAGSAERSK